MGTLQTSQAEVRVRAIRDAVDLQAHRGRVWLWGWSLGYGALTVGQAVPAAFVGDHGLRADLIAGAATSAVGLVAVLASPPESIASAAALDRELSDGTLATDPCAALARAEDLLDRAARDQAFATSWVMHAANAGVNVAAGLVLGFGYHRWSSGALATAVGIAVGEAQILTVPTGLLHFDSPAAKHAAVDSAVLVPWIGRDGYGLQLAGAF